MNFKPRSSQELVNLYICKVLKDVDYATGGISLDRNQVTFLLGMNDRSSITLLHSGARGILEN